MNTTRRGFFGMLAAGAAALVAKPAPTMRNMPLNDGFVCYNSGTSFLTHTEFGYSFEVTDADLKWELPLSGNSRQRRKERRRRRGVR